MSFSIPGMESIAAPAGLATLNYQEPMHGDLLWVYEGLTDYYGNILAARTGLRSP